MSEQSGTNDQIVIDTNAYGGGQQPGTEQERTFTQAEINAIVAERLKREQAKYADYDELKQAQAQLKELERAQMSELEQAQARAAELEAERDEALAQAAQTLVRASFMSEAAKAGVAFPEDAYRLAELDGVEVDEDGKVSGVAEIVMGLVESGRLVMSAAKPQAPSLDGGAGGGQRAAEQLPSLTQEELDFARKMGVSAESYARRKAEIQAKKG